MHLTLRHFKVSKGDVVQSMDVASLVAKIERIGAKATVQILDPEAPVILADVLDVFPARAGWTGCPWSFSQQQALPEGIDNLQDVAVTMVGRFSGATPCLLPLKGPWAPLARRTHVVVRMSPLDAAQDWEIKVIVGQWIQEWVSALVKMGEPEAIEKFSWDRPLAPSLPKVVYVYQVQSQGPMRRTYVHGAACDGQEPRLLSPLAVLGGAILSANYVLCGQRNATLFHAENPVVRELLHRHGKSLDLCGVILTPAASSEADKRRIAGQVARLATRLDAEGAIITKEGGGNTTVDLMLIIDALEEQGVKTTGLVNEMAGAQGDQPPLIMQTSRANALVSTGNIDQVVDVAPDLQVVGGIEGTAEIGCRSIELAKVHGSTNLLGLGTWGCRDA